VDEFVLRAYGHEGEARRAAGPEGDAVAEAALRNTRTYAERVLADPRYRREANSKPPRKIGSRLTLFDCITCDKCVPVCPNDANFPFSLDGKEIPSVRLRPDGDGWAREDLPPVTTVRKHQIGNFADFCNDCGNCDVFCPEDGGPYVLKPRFFGSRQAFEADGRDGFFLERTDGGSVVHGRFGATEVQALFRGDGTALYSGPRFRVELDRAAPEETIRGTAEGHVDLTWYRILERLADALLGEGNLTWPGVTAGAGKED